MVPNSAEEKNSRPWAFTTPKAGQAGAKNRLQGAEQQLSDSSNWNENNGPSLSLGSRCGKSEDGSPAPFSAVSFPARERLTNS